MTDPSEPKTSLTDLAESFGPAEWESGRQTSIGGAGVSTALVLLLTQIGPDSDLLMTAFYTSAGAIPIWLALWQVGNAYAVRPRAKRHFARIGAFVGSALFILAGILTFASLFTLILAYSVGAGFVFGVVSFIMVIFVFLYHFSVQNSGRDA